MFHWLIDLIQGGARIDLTKAKIMKTMFRIVLLVLCFQLVGCASRIKSNQVRVTYHSDPPGAILSDPQQNWGMAPQTRIYTGNKSDGVVRAEVAAVWPSGVRETYSSVMKFGREERVITISRPLVVTGFVEDMNFAKQLKQNAEEKKREENKREERSQENANALFLGVLTGIVQVINARNGVPTSDDDSSDERSDTFKAIMSDEKKKGSSASRYDPGYQTRDSFGNIVNSKDSYQTKDSNGALVNSRDSYQTRDSFGNLVNSRDCFQTKTTTGALVQSAGCTK